MIFCTRKLEGPDFLHDIVSIAFPWQSMPPKAGGVQLRALKEMPVVQEELVVQLDQFPHIPHVPLTAGNES